MTCLKISKGDVQSMIDKGDVRFSESETHEDPKFYIIESDKTNGLKVKIELQDSTSLIQDFLAPKAADCGC